MTCAVDHRALLYNEIQELPTTGRIIWLLEHLSGYCFNLYYVKGKDRILCDYLSRIAVDKGDPGEVIPISFNALAQYRLVIEHITESFMITHFMVATRSGTSAAGINLPPIHGAQKGIDPTLKPERQSKSQQTLLKPTPMTLVEEKYLALLWEGLLLRPLPIQNLGALSQQSNSQKFAKHPQYNLELPH